MRLRVSDAPQHLAQQACSPTACIPTKSCAPCQDLAPERHLSRPSKSISIFLCSSHHAPMMSHKPWSQASKLEYNKTGGPTMQSCMKQLHQTTPGRSRRPAESHGSWRRGMLAWCSTSGAPCPSNAGTCVSTAAISQGLHSGRAVAGTHERAGTCSMGPMSVRWCEPAIDLSTSSRCAVSGQGGLKTGRCWHCSRRTICICGRPGSAALAASFCSRPAVEGLTDAGAAWQTADKAEYHASHPKSWTLQTTPRFHSLRRTRGCRLSSQGFFSDDRYPALTARSPRSELFDT